MQGPPRPVGVSASAAVLAALNLILYAPALDNGFSLDDYNWLARAEFAPSWWRFVFDVEPGQIFNPVPRALFLLIEHLGGGTALPFHVAVVVLHIVTVGLFLRLVDRLVGDRTIALLAALLFSLQTSYDEAIFWVAAFFYPLSGVLGLGALVAADRYLADGGRGAAFATALCSLAGMLTKASCVALLPVMLLLPGTRTRRTVLATTLASLALAVAAVNVAFGAGQSYLVTEGHYRLGFHMVGNLLHYLGWMALPFDQALGPLGLTAAWAAWWKVLGAVVLVAVVLCVPRTGRMTRPLVALLFLPLVPVLPFTFDPASRYTYLPALGAAALCAVLLAFAGGRAAWTRWLRSPLLLAVGLLSLADTRVRDNHYEYRERLMARWVSDVVGAVPAPPPGGTIRIVDLPRLAIDPGIHLEAALRLAYGDQRLRLDVVGSGDEPPRVDVPMLWYVQGRIVERRIGGLHGSEPSSGEVPRDDVPEVDQVDPEQREPGGGRGQGTPSTGELSEADGDQHGAGRGQHQEVAALGLEVVPAVDEQCDQQHEVGDDRPCDDPVRSAPIRSGSAPACEEGNEPRRRSRRQREVDRQGPRVRQHLHPAEGTPPTLERAPEERGGSVLTEKRQLWPGIGEPERPGGERERIVATVQQNVSGDPWRCHQQGEGRSGGGRQRPPRAFLDDPEPGSVQGNREQSADLDQHSETDEETDQQGMGMSRHGKQQPGPHQLDSRVVAHGHRHRAAHRMERDEEGRRRPDPAIIGEHRAHEQRHDGDDTTREQQIEQPHGGERSGRPVQQCGDQVEQGGLVRLVGDLRDAWVARRDSPEVSALQAFEFFRGPCAVSHHRQAAAIGDGENIVDVGRLVRPVECRYRRQVTEREGRVNEHRGRGPRSVHGGTTCEESLHEV